jgi:hypothetical protein
VFGRGQKGTQRKLSNSADRVTKVNVLICVIKWVVPFLRFDTWPYQVELTVGCQKDPQALSMLLRE